MVIYPTEARQKTTCETIAHCKYKINFLKLVPKQAKSR